MARIMVLLFFTNLFTISTAFVRAGRPGRQTPDGNISLPPTPPTFPCNAVMFGGRNFHEVSLKLARQESDHLPDSLGLSRKHILEMLLKAQ